mmetsp:Transcript_72531/g.193401  ORF Transcript_72531/g.193401 Transcript_72531/m.193401 type:complete len:89 (-) Transcript_72531:271-537(-)
MGAWDSVVASAASFFAWLTSSLPAVLVISMVAACGCLLGSVLLAEDTEASASRAPLIELQRFGMDLSEAAGEPGEERVSRVSFQLPAT